MSRIPIIAALLVSLGFFACKDKPGLESGEAGRPAVTGVTVSRLATETVTDFYETSGTLAAATTSLVASRLMGAVTSLTVEEGDTVAAGQLLLTIDDRDMRQKLRAAEASLGQAQKGLEVARARKDLAEVTYARFSRLFEGRALSRQELEQVATEREVAALECEKAGEMVRGAEAGLEEARVYLGFTRVTAPFAGVVTEKKVAAGSLAVPGMTLLVIEADAPLEVRAFADESLAGRLLPGTAVELLVAGREEELAGTITEIVPAVDPGSRAFPVKITLTQAGLQSGLYVKVRIPAGERKTLLVPAQAVVRRGQLTGVFAVAEGGEVSYRLVRTGKEHGDRLEILSGLERGEKIITGGLERAVDGGLLQGPEER